MSSGLNAVLGVNVSFVSKKDKKAEDLSVIDFPPKSDLKELKVSDNDESCFKDMAFGQPHPVFWSLFGLFSDSIKKWDFTEEYIVKMVDLQILKSLNQTITQDVLNNFPNNLSTYLSFEAQLVRSEIIAWALGRMAADFQSEIDNKESLLDQWTSGLDFGISAINTLSNFFSGSSTRRSLVKMGDSYVMMAQDAAEGSDNTNFLYKFSENKKSEEEKSLGYHWYHKPMYNSPILLCIQSLCQAADQAMEEIADEEVKDKSAEDHVLYTKKIPKIIQTEPNRHEKEKSIVQNEIVDKVALYIANYYMMSSFVAPINGIYRGYIELKPGEGDKFVRSYTSDNQLQYVGYKDDKLKNAASEKVLFEIHEHNKYKDVDPEKTNYRINDKLLPNQPYRLLLPMKAPANKKLNDLKDEDIKLFLEVVEVTPNVTTNGAEVEVKIKLPESIEASLSSSIVHTGFNFKFTIPKKVYKNGLTGDLVTGDKLNGNGEAAQQVFIDIAQNFVKAINPILEANPITSNLEMFKNTAPDLMDSAKLFVEFRKSQLFFKNDTMKSQFERAADCYGAIPSVLEHSLAYIKSGHYFDANTHVRSITPTATIPIELKEQTSYSSVRLDWDTDSRYTEYNLYKNGQLCTHINKTINLTPNGSYSFYVHALDADRKVVLAQSHTIIVTTKRFELKHNVPDNNIFSTLFGRNSKPVTLTWDGVSEAGEYANKFYVFQDGEKIGETDDYNLTKTTSPLSSGTYEFYVEALNASNTVLATSKKVNVTIP